MKLYSVTITEWFESYHIDDDPAYLISRFISNDSLLEEWGGKELKLQFRGKKRPLAFCFTISGLLLTQKGKKMLGDVFSDEDTELIPLVFGTKEFFLVHCTKSVKLDAFELESWTIGKPLYHMNLEEIESHNLQERYYFKVELNNGRLSDLLFTEKFINLVKEREIQGVEFEELWDSEGENGER